MKGETMESAIRFLQEYRRGRLAMIRAGLLPDFSAMLSDPQLAHIGPDLQAQLQNVAQVAEKRDVIDLLETRVARPVFEYIKQRPTQPTTVNEVLGLVQQWAESKRRGAQVSGYVNTVQEEGERRQWSGDRVAAVGDTATSAALMAGAGAPLPVPILGKGKGKGEAPECPTCKGRHGDVRVCPSTTFARSDSKFQPNPALQCRWRCFMRYRCNGRGHLARHHMAQVKSEKPDGKGGNKGGHGIRALYGGSDPDEGEDDSLEWCLQACEIEEASDATQVPGQSCVALAQPVLHEGPSGDRNGPAAGSDDSNGVAGQLATLTQSLPEDQQASLVRALQLTQSSGRVGPTAPSGSKGESTRSAAVPTAGGFRVGAMYQP